MWSGPVFKNEESLPLSEIKSTVGYGKIFAGFCDGCPKMRRHVIRSFISMSVGWIVFWCEFLQPRFEISSGRGVSILSNQQTCAGMTNKDGAEPCFYIGTPDRLFDRESDLVKATSWSFESDGFSVHGRDPLPQLAPA